MTFSNEEHKLNVQEALAALSGELSTSKESSVEDATSTQTATSVAQKTIAQLERRFNQTTRNILSYDTKR